MYEKVDIRRAERRLYGLRNQLVEKEKRKLIRRRRRVE
jgi:hypothetical protein